MAKSLIKRMLVDVALKPHKCRWNKRHHIAAGDKRLKVIEGRSKLHYCTECAKKFLGTGIEDLSNILSGL